MAVLLPIVCRHAPHPILVLRCYSDYSKVGTALNRLVFDVSPLNASLDSRSYDFILCHHTLIPLHQRQVLPSKRVEVWTDLKPKSS